MELKLVAISQYVAGHGYEAVIRLNGLMIWTDDEVFDNHITAEVTANDKMLDVFKKLFK